MLLAQRIVAEIADKNLAPGTPISHEKEMLEKYGVARGTLRETLRFLEIHGVITIKTGPGGGPIVAKPGSRHLGSVIAMMLQLEHASFRSVLEARSTLEPALSRGAAEHITEDEIAGLYESIERMRENLDDDEFFLQENEEFHALVASAAGNEFFALVIGSLSWICDASPLGVEYPLSSREAVLEMHKEIADAIAAGDADEAAAKMAVHIGDFASYLNLKYPQVIDAPLRWDQLEP